nr:retrotransposon Orf1 [Tanacetum cinerariifolium]
MLYHYKLGLSQVEARLVEFKNQEIKFCEKIRGLEFNVESKNNRIERLTNELEELKKEKEGLDSKLIGFESASKDLDTLLGSQRSDKNKEGLHEFADDTITDYSRPSPSIEKSIMSKPMIKFVKEADSPGVIKTNKTKTARKPPVKYAEMYRNTSKSPKVRGNQRNWNNLMNRRLKSNFVMKNKACFKCGHFDHLAYDCGLLVEKGKNWSKNNFAHEIVTPRADLFKIASVSAARRVNTAAPRPNVNSARPKTTQDLVIILIQRVKRLERKLKARTPPTKIYKVDVRGRSRSVMAWVPKKV